MRIAFDLDGMLIPAPGSPMAVEPLGLLPRLVSGEKIRAGAPHLLAALHRGGHEIWLYTTSYRSPARLRAWFAAFGVRLTGVINQARHDAVVSRALPSKYPPAFGIDLLVDDAQAWRWRDDATVSACCTLSSMMRRRARRSCWRYAWRRIGKASAAPSRHFQPI